MIQAQDRKSRRSAVACKGLRAAVFIKIFLIGILWIANSLVCWGVRTGGLYWRKSISGHQAKDFKKPRSAPEMMRQLRNGRHKVDATQLKHRAAWLYLLVVENPRNCHMRHTGR
jgi:hypothetical protein